jgi:hypothetical protein
MINLVPGHFYRSAADEVWCCFIAREGGSFGVVRLRDSRISTVDQAGRGVNILLIERMLVQSCRACGTAI